MSFARLHIAAAVVHTLCALYAFATPAFYGSIPLRAARVAVDATSFRRVQVFTVHIPSAALLHGIVAVVTALFHILVYIPIYRSVLAQRVWDQGYLMVRWAEYAITCTLMSLASSTTSGDDDLNHAVALLLSGAALQLVGACIEQNRRASAGLLAVGGLINAAASYPTVWYILTAEHSEETRWVAFLAYTFYYALFPLNCFWDAVYRTDFRRTDWVYALLSLTSKVALFWIQVGEESDFQVYVLGVALPLVILLLGLRVTPKGTTDVPAPAVLTALVAARIIPAQSQSEQIPH